MIPTGITIYICVWTLSCYLQLLAEIPEGGRGALAVVVLALLCGAHNLLELWRIQVHTYIHTYVQNIYLRHDSSFYNQSVNSCPDEIRTHSQ